MQIGLFPYTTAGTTAGPRSERQDERGVSAAPKRASGSSSATGTVDLVTAVGPAVAPLSILVEAASLFPPAETVGAGSATTEIDSGVGGSVSLPLPRTGEGAAAPEMATETLVPPSSGGDGGSRPAADPPVFPGSGNRAREPIYVELRGSRPAVDGSGDLPPLRAPTAVVPQPPPRALPGSAPQAGEGEAPAQGTVPAAPAGAPGGASAAARPAAEDTGAGGPGATEELTEEEQQQVQELKQRDREVRQHEQAHVSAGGQYVRGGASYEYTTGPDRKRYATGGEVSIDTSEVPDNPEATIRKAQVVYRAALAPAEPSGQDRRVASEAKQLESEARRDLAEERREETRETTGAARGDGEEPAAGAEAETVVGGSVGSEPGGAATDGAGGGTAASIASPVAEPSRPGGPMPVVGEAADGALAPPELYVDVDARTRSGVGRLLDVVA